MKRIVLLVSAALLTAAVPQEEKKGILEDQIPRENWCLEKVQNLLLQQDRMEW